MESKKLTARLSDGTEWEVLDRFDNRFYGQSEFTTAFSVRPLKKPPLEWWAVEDKDFPNMHCFFISKTEAEDHYVADKLRRGRPFLVREVVSDGK